MPPSDLAQVAFIRGKLYEQKGENENALRDYYRVFTLGQRDASLSKSAMAAAMKLQAEDPRLKSSNEKAKAAAIRQMQSLAYNYSKRFPGSTLPLDLQDYNTGPRIDLVVQKAPEPVATPAAAAAPAKAPPKPDPKAKGKPQPKGKKPQSKGKPKGKKGK